MAYKPRISRREALARIAALSSTLPMLGCVYPAAPETTKPWPELNLSPTTAPGYGTDPNLLHPPTQPWPGLLNEDQLNLVAGLSEAICPGARAAAVPDVLNEWISAPYPTQRHDRALIEPGLAWFKAECERRYGLPTTGNDWEKLSSEQLLAPLEALDLDRAPEAHTQPQQFVQRFRLLVTGAYFSSERGVKELGYAGNVPIAGDYPGPPEAAQQHLKSLLDELGLSL